VPNKPHFQAVRDDFSARKLFLLASAVDLGHQLPLKYFQYNQRMPPITMTDQGAGNTARHNSQAPTPTELTKAPETMARIKTGMRSQNLINGDSENCVCIFKSLMVNIPFQYLRKNLS
jgi:hypothetical protein